MIEDTKPLNAADKMRKLLFNYDLELESSMGELKLARAKITRYGNSTVKRDLEQYTNARIDEEKLLVFIKQLTKGKNETFQALENLLNTYAPKHKKIWLMHFISGFNYDEIAEKTFYSLSSVKRIIKKLKQDLIEYTNYKEDDQDE